MLSAGVLDPTFGQGGKVVTDTIGTLNDYAQSVLVNTAAGTITAVGYGGTNAVEIASYSLASGAPNTAFAGGSVRTNLVGQDMAAALQSDGRVLVLGFQGLLRYNTDGTLDTTFGNAGVETFALSVLNSTSFSPTSIAVQGSQVLVAGQAYAYQSGTYSFGVLRFNSNGTLDTTFGNGGLASVSVGSNAYPSALAVAPDGSIGLAGHVSVNSTGDVFTVARLTAGGQPMTSFAGGYEQLSLGNSSSDAYAVAFQSDGSGGFKLVAGGGAYTWVSYLNGQYYYSYYQQYGEALVRFNADGSLDTTFYNGGEVLRGDGAAVQGLAVQSDGSLVTTVSNHLARYTASGVPDSSFYGEPITGTIYDSAYRSVAVAGNSIVAGGFISQSSLAGADFAVSVLNSSGYSNTSFGQNGTATTGFSASTQDTSRAVLVDGSGRILQVGSNDSASGAVVLTRTDANGVRDTSFGSGGTVVTTGIGNGLGAALQSDGRIVVATSQGAVRYNTDGSLDTSFGSGGEVNPATLGLPSAYPYFAASSVAIQGSSILLAGQAYSPSLGRYIFGVLRLTSAGQLDTSFGNGLGVAAADFGNTAYATAVAVAPDGTIGLAGYTFLSSGNTDFAVAEFTANGGQVAGTSTLSLGSYGQAAAAVFQPTGTGGSKLVVVGSGFTTSGAYGEVLARFNGDGSLDTSFGTGGEVITGDGYAGQGLAVQPDGSLVTAEGYRLTRRTASGAADTSFGPGGASTSNYQNDLTGVALAADGNIIAGGYTSNYFGPTGQDLLLVRYSGVNHAPTASAGGPYTISALSGVTLDGSGSSDPDGDPLTYTWTVNGHSAGVTGSSKLTLGWSTLAGDGLQPGQPATIDLTVSDGYGGTSSASTTLAAVQLTPTVSVTDAEASYSGTAHAATATVNGGSSLEGVGLTLDYQVLDGTGSVIGDLGAQPPSDAGSYRVTASFAGSTDYTAASASVNFKIDPAALSVTPADVLNKVYGTTATLTGMVSGLASGESFDITYASAGAAASAPVGSYDITVQSVASNGHGKTSNYTITTNTATLTVTAAPLSVTADSPTVDFGQPLPALSGTLIGLVKGDSITASFGTTATSSSPVGTYPVTPTLNDPNGLLVNYSVTNTPGTLTVLAAPSSVAVSSSAQTSTYGTAVTFTATVSALAPSTATPTGSVQFLVDGVAVGSTVPLVDGSATSDAIASLTAGEHLVTASYTADSNFQAGDPGSLTQSVATAPLVVTPDNAERYYGASDPAFTGELTGVVNHDDITATYATTATASSDVGTYPITATLNDPGGKLSNYAVTSNSGTLTIDAAPTVLSLLIAKQKGKTKGGAGDYGIAQGPVTADVSVDPSLAPGDTVTPTGSVQFYLDGQPFGAPVDLSGGQATSPDLGVLPAGDHLVSAVYINDTAAGAAGDGDFTGSSATSDLTITQAVPLITWPNPADIVYGTPLSGTQLDATATAPNLGGMPVDGTFLYTPGVGTVLNAGAGQDLSVTFTPSDTTDYESVTFDVLVNVLKADQTIGFPTPADRTFGDAPFAPSATDTSGLPLTFTVVSGPATIANGMLTITGAGAVTVEASQAGDDNNNAATPVDVTFNVAQATPTVVVSGAGSFTYDGTSHAATAEVYGLDGIDLGAATVVYIDPQGHTLTAAPVHAGTYTVQATYAGGDDYAGLTDTSTQVVVTPAHLTVVADAQSKTFDGAPFTAFTAHLTGFVHGEDADSAGVTGEANFIGAAVGAVHASTYTVTPVPGDLSAPDYDFTSFTPGTLTISPEKVTVTADPQAKVYGTADPVLTYSITSGSLVGSDSFNGALTRAAGEDVGTYAIGQGTLALNSDYELSFAGANLIVTPRAITVTADPQTKVYGAEDPPLTYSVTAGSLVGTDGFSGALTRAAGESPGSYAITQGTLSAGGNYDLSYTGSNLLITPAATVTSLTSSANPAVPGQAVTFTAVVSTVSPGGGIPAGSVVFSLGSTVLATVPLSAIGTGQVSFTTSSLPVGTSTVTAAYFNSDGNEHGSSSSLDQTVFGPGVHVSGTTLYLVGANTNDSVEVAPAGAGTDGSTGLTVEATLNRVETSRTFKQPFTAVVIAGYGGNDEYQIGCRLTLSVTVTAGDGNDEVQLGNGDSTVTLGNGNDQIIAGDGNNTITLGNGNDQVLLGDGDNVVVEGNGNDQVTAGNGANLVVGGLGRHEIRVGNGDNILIDGAVTLTQPDDSLRKVLNDWRTSPATAVNQRFKVTYNAAYPNSLRTGSGRDWFFYTFSKTKSNRKATDRLN